VFLATTKFRGCPGGRHLTRKRIWEGFRIFGTWGAVVYALLLILKVPFKMEFLGGTPEPLALAVAAPFFAQAARLEVVLQREVSGLQQRRGHRESYYAQWFRTYAADIYRDIVATLKNDDRSQQFLQAGLAKSYSVAELADALEKLAKQKSDDDLRKFARGTRTTRAQTQTGKRSTLAGAIVEQSFARGQELTTARAEAIVELDAWVVPDDQ